MIPIRNDQPRTSIPWVNYLLIAANVGVFAYQLVHAGADDDAALRRVRLQTRGEIRGVADGEVVSNLRRADVSHNRGTGVEANPETGPLTRRGNWPTVHCIASAERAARKA